MPEVLGEQLGVALGVLARVARRHRHAVDVLGTERVDGDAGHDRGVDATRQRDHDVVEAVLPAVVAGAEHQRVVELAVGVERRRRSSRSRIVVHDRFGGDLDRRQQRLGDATARVEQPLAVDRRNRHVDDHQVLDELRRPCEQRAFVVEHDRPAVEHQLVLATDLVDVDDRRVRIRCTGRQHPFAFDALARVERRGVDVDADLGAGGSLFGDGPERAPDVLADRDADLDAADDEQLQRIGLVARREVAGLVEHRRVRQQPLAVRADDLAVGAHRGGVVEVAVLVDETDDGGTSTGASGELRQRREVVGDEAGLQHQVLGRIPGGRQLGERDDVAAGGLGAVVRVEHLGQVPVEVAHGRVELSEPHSQHRHDRPGYLRRRRRASLRTGGSDLALWPRGYGSGGDRRIAVRRRLLTGRGSRVDPAADVARHDHDHHVHDHHDDHDPRPPSLRGRDPPDHRRRAAHHRRHPRRRRIRPGLGQRRGPRLHADRPDPQGHQHPCRSARTGRRGRERRQRLRLEGHRPRRHRRRRLRDRLRRRSSSSSRRSPPDGTTSSPTSAARG